MEDRVKVYAEWLVQNQDKADTPEYEKVKRAYTKLRTATPMSEDNSLANDIGYRGVVGGLRDAAVETAETVGDIALSASKFGLTSLPAPVAKAHEKMREQSDEDLLPLPEVPEPETTAGRIARPVTQFFAPFIPALKFTRAASGGKAATAIGRYSQDALASALTSAGTQDPEAKNLSNTLNELAQKHDAPELVQAVTDFLSAKPGDSKELARFKKALEDFGLTSMFFVGEELLSPVLRKFFGGNMPVEEIAEAGEAAGVVKAVEKAEREAPVAFDQAVGEDALEGMRWDSDATFPGLSKEQQEKIKNAALEAFEAGGMKPNKTMLISDQILQGMVTGKISATGFEEILQRHGMTWDEFAQATRMTYRVAGQTLNRLSQLQKSLKTLSRVSDEEKELLAKFGGVDGADLSRGMYQRIDNIRRGLMVTQLATAARNFQTQAGRVGVDVLQKGLDNAFLTITGKKTAGDALYDTFAVANRLLFRKNKEQVTEILSMFPKEETRLFMRYSSDINNQTGKGLMGTAEDAVQLLNTVNRFQEYLIRRAVFAGELDVLVKNKMGMTLDELIAKGGADQLPESLVRQAVDKSLEMTWAKEFSRHSSKAYDEFAAAVIDITHKSKIGTIINPFPRFLMNSIKFQYEYSPLGFAGALKLLSKEEREIFSSAMQKGEMPKAMQSITKATLGSGMLYTAWQLRNSEYAGEKWYELNVPAGMRAALGEIGVEVGDDQRIDVRAFNPFASYLFVAEIIRKSNDGTLHTLSFKDLAQGILGSGARAGTGLFLIDKFIEEVSVGANTDLDNEELWRRFTGMAGEYVGSFVMPFQQLKDLVAEFDEKEAVMYEPGSGTLSDAFWEPTRRKIPYATQLFKSEGMEPATTPTSTKELSRREPLARQLTGLTIGKEKNEGEKELDRLSFAYNEIFTSTGTARTDHLKKKAMAPLFERYVVPFVQSANYLKQADSVKRVMLKDRLNLVNRLALSKAMWIAETPQDKKLFLQLMTVERVPRDERRAYGDLLGQDLESLFNERVGQENEQ